MTDNTIYIACAAILRGDGQTYLVRKTGSAIFQQPGGKIDAGETAVTALIRELQEEIGLTLTSADLSPLGRFSAPAANEAGHLVVAEVFVARHDGPLQVAAELAEGRWIDPEAPPCDMQIAALSRGEILPRLQAR